ncbi:MAG TPA: hypothetical protein VMZ26_03870 [Pyrinomonadaceae bacterium]|nr:hypothetical protein [Pyrinomonadaceae bacterium]
MFRVFLSAASVCVLFTATLFFPGAVSARRCAIEVPSTLLSLYRGSQFIYVGKFDKSEEGDTGEPIDGENRYRIIPIKKHYSISSSLKGESRKILVLQETEYRSEPEAAVTVEAEANTLSEEGGDQVLSAEQVGAEEETSDDVAEIDDTELKPGDSVLLFLSKDEDSGELVLSDYDDGLKKMTADELAAYSVRIRELNEIFSAEKPSYSDIVSWLVRCAEDPATRWEGTYELLRSFQNVELQEERSKQPAAPENQAAVEPNSAPEPYVPAPPKKFETGDVNFAKELTEGQKLILTDILLKRERPKVSTKAPARQSIGHGDRELIELVKRWGNSSVAANFVEQLKYDASDTGLNSELMASIASILGDERLTTIAGEYSNIQWESDEDEAASEDTAANSEDVDQSPEQESKVADAPVSTADVAAGQLTDIVDQATLRDDAAEPEAAPDNGHAKKKTYVQLRSELIEKFVDRAEKLIARERKMDYQN